MRFSRMVGLLTLALGVPALAMTNQPTGFGKAKFGQSVADVRKLLPAMEPTQAHLGAMAFTSEFLQRFAIKDATVAGLAKPTTVELRFWKDKLWTVIVYFGSNPQADVEASLTKQLGPPTASSTASMIWRGDRTEVQSVTKGSYYAITENELSKDVQAWFTAQLVGQGYVSTGPGGTPSPAATASSEAAPPAETPAAK